MSMDWSTWKPTQRTVLVFIINHGQILLIRKKRGLGQGKINGPGGKVEPDEIPLQAAIRETREEVGVTPIGLEAAGELSFQFTDGLGIYCLVFRAHNFRGLLTETEEAEPLWLPIDKIPFEQMWADDIFWFPHLLNGQIFRGFFTLENDKLLSSKIELCQKPPSKEIKN